MCVTVGDAPEVVEGLEDTIVVAPEDAVLSCEITPGNPKAAIHWYKEAKEIYKNKKYLMSYSDNVAELTVKNLEPSDAAAYRCEAVNKIGRVETQCVLTIQSKLSFCSFVKCFTFI